MTAIWNMIVDGVSVNVDDHDTGTLDIYAFHRDAERVVDCTVSQTASDDEVRAACVRVADVTLLDAAERSRLARHLYGYDREIVVEEWSRDLIVTWLACRVDRVALARMFPSWPSIATEYPDQARWCVVPAARLGAIRWCDVKSATDGGVLCGVIPWR